MGTIVEFMGMPGSGKTTICNRVARQLRDIGYSVLLLQDIKDHYASKSVFEKARLIRVFVNSCLPELVRYVRVVNDAKLLDYKSIYRFVRLNIFRLVVKELSVQRNFDFILLEQWMIQEMWSVIVFNADVYSNLSDRLAPFFFTTDYLLYFMLDAKTAAQRIESRKNGKSRFDQLPKDVRISVLERYELLFDHLFTSATCRNKIEIDAKEDVLDIIKMVFDSFENLRITTIK